MNEVTHLAADPLLPIRQGIDIGVDPGVAFVGHCEFLVRVPMRHGSWPELIGSPWFESCALWRTVDGPSLAPHARQGSCGARSRGSCMGIGASCETPGRDSQSARSPHKHESTAPSPAEVAPGATKGERQRPHVVWVAPDDSVGAGSHVRPALVSPRATPRCRARGPRRPPRRRPPPDAQQWRHAPRPPRGRMRAPRGPDGRPRASERRPSTARRSAPRTR